MTVEVDEAHLDVLLASKRAVDLYRNWLEVPSRKNRALFGMQLTELERLEEKWKKTTTSPASKR